MDSDTTYRMILSSGLFIICVIVTGIIWPRKVPQKRYDSPLLQVQPRNIVVETVVIEPTEVPVTENIEIQCLLCHWENNFNTREITRLFELIDRYHGQMSTPDLANMLHLYYNQQILTENSTEILELSTVIEHLEGKHRLDTKMFIGESIRKYQKIMDTMKVMIYSPGDTIDHTAFVAIQETQNKLQELYSMTPVSHMD